MNRWMDEWMVTWVDGYMDSWMAPKDIAYTWWSCHSGMANTVHIVSTPPSPSNGCPITVFLG